MGTQDVVFSMGGADKERGDEEEESRKVYKPTIPISYSQHAYIKESRFCYSLSGLEVPELTITS